MVAINFKAQDDVQQRSFDPVPAGEYKVAIVASEIKVTSKGDGRYIKFEIQIIDGQHKGRKLWEKVNFDNPNKTTVRIADEQLSLICHACGKDEAADTDELHNIPMTVKIKSKKREDNGEMQNYVATWFDARPGGKAATGTTPPVADNTNKPWLRK